MTEEEDVLTNSPGRELGYEAEGSSLTTAVSRMERATP